MKNSEEREGLVYLKERMELALEKAFPYMGTEENPHFMEEMIDHQRDGFRTGFMYRQEEVDKHFEASKCYIEDIQELVSLLQDYKNVFKKNMPIWFDQHLKERTKKLLDKHIF